MLLQASDKGESAQVMECLNTENTKKNLGKRRAVGAKPASLELDNMKKPIATIGATADNQPAAADQKQQDNEDSSDVDLDCLACGS